MHEQAKKEVMAPSAVGPIVTKERFSEASGLRVDQVRGMIANGYLPTLKIGKHRMINMALLTSECLQDAIEI
ncbi:MAG: hypothetical protein RPS47_03770 [Colwellia sp.]|jgi:hypothetical protein